MLNKLKSLILRGLQKLTPDDTQDLGQKAQVQFMGQTQDIQLITPYGFYSCSPVNSEWVIWSVRGNPSDRVGIPNDYKNRPKNLNEGDVCLVNLVTGDYIKILMNGSINIKTSKVLNVDAPVTNWTGNINLTGNIVAVGEVTANGIALSTHTHGGVTSGGANTAVPNP